MYIDRDRHEKLAKGSMLTVGISRMKVGIFLVFLSPPRIYNYEMEINSDTNNISELKF